MKSDSYHCDVCNKIRGEANHWKMVRSAANGRPEFFRDWDDSVARHPETKHLCGAECVHRMLDRYLSTGTLDADKPASSD